MRTYVRQHLYGWIRGTQYIPSDKRQMYKISMLHRRHLPCMDRNAKSTRRIFQHFKPNPSFNKVHDRTFKRTNKLPGHHCSSQQVKTHHKNVQETYWQILLSPQHVLPLLKTTYHLAKLCVWKRYAPMKVITKHLKSNWMTPSFDGVTKRNIYKASFRKQMVNLVKIYLSRRQEQKPPGFHSLRHSTRAFLTSKVQSTNTGIY